MNMLEALRLWVDPTHELFGAAAKKRHEELKEREAKAELAACAEADKIRDARLALKRTSQPPTGENLPGFRTLASELKSANKLMQKAFQDGQRPTENSSGPESTE